MMTCNIIIKQETSLNISQQMEMIKRMDVSVWPYENYICVWFLKKHLILKVKSQTGINFIPFFHLLEEFNITIS